MIWKVLGSLLLLKYGISLSQFLWMMMRLYLLPKYGMKKDLRKYGSWAVITGATDGIGKAIAKQLAKRGINVVLISRSPDKLKAVSEEFQVFNVEVKTITYDFNSVHDYALIEEGLKDLEVGILVNNVGVGYDHPEYFGQLSDEFCARTINVNVFSVQKMTKIVLDGMSKRKSGLIVHVSSYSGLVPIPLLGIYSASKAFVNFFSKALRYEYASSGIDHQVITPDLVATNLSQAKARGIFVPNADRFAQEAVNAFGLSSTMSGCWAHELQYHLRNIVPRGMLTSTIMKVMMKGRNRWLRKQQEKTD